MKKYFNLNYRIYIHYLVTHFLLFKKKVSLADYDGEIHSSGETKTNRLLNAFEVYKQLTENNDLKSIPFIVLLNKYDLFEKKIKNISIQIAFPEIENKF